MSFRTGRSQISYCFDIFACLALSATVVLSPFRYRFTWLARPFEPVYRDYTDFLFFASDLFLVLTLVLWLISLLLKPRRLHAGPLFLSIPLAGLTVMSWVSVIFSVDPLLSGYHTLRLALLAGLYLYLVNQVKTLSAVILPVALQVFVQATVGIGQVLQQRSLGLDSLGELVLDPTWSGVSIVWAAGTRYLRAYGLSDHPNILGGCLAFGLVLLAGWYVTAETKWHVPISGLWALGALGLFLTFSRSAWLALGGGLLLIALIFLKNGQTGAGRNWLNLMLAGLIVVFPFLWQYADYVGVRLNWRDSFAQVADESRSMHERQALNSVANHIFADHALTGVGVGAFPVALRRQAPDFPFNYQPPHVALLEVAAETGLFGALFYFLALVSPWLAVWFNRDQLKFSPHLVAISGVLAAVTIVGLFDYYPWLLGPGRLWQYLVWGLWGSLYLNVDRGQEYA
jgi:O-antigen ligase